MQNKATSLVDINLNIAEIYNKICIHLPECRIEKFDDMTRGICAFLTSYYLQTHMMGDEAKSRFLNRLRKLSDENTQISHEGQHGENTLPIEELRVFIDNLILGQYCQSTLPCGLGYLSEKQARSTPGNLASMFSSHPDGQAEDATGSDGQQEELLPHSMYVGTLFGKDEQSKLQLEHFFNQLQNLPWPKRGWTLQFTTHNHTFCTVVERNEIRFFDQGQKQHLETIISDDQSEDRVEKLCGKILETIHAHDPAVQLSESSRGTYVCGVVLRCSEETYDQQKEALLSLTQEYQKKIDQVYLKVPEAEPAEQYLERMLATIVARSKAQCSSRQDDAFKAFDYLVKKKINWNARKPDLTIRLEEISGRLIRYGIGLLLLILLVGYLAKIMWHVKTTMLLHTLSLGLITLAIYPVIIGLVGFGVAFLISRYRKEFCYGNKSHEQDCWKRTLVGGIFSRLHNGNKSKEQDSWKATLVHLIFLHLYNDDSAEDLIEVMHAWIDQIDSVIDPKGGTKQPILSGARVVLIRNISVFKKLLCQDNGQGGVKEYFFERQDQSNLPIDGQLYYKVRREALWEDSIGRWQGMFSEDFSRACNELNENVLRDDVRMVMQTAISDGAINILQNMLSSLAPSSYTDKGKLLTYLLKIARYLEQGDAEFFLLKRLQDLERNSADFKPKLEDPKEVIAFAKHSGITIHHGYWLRQLRLAIQEKKIGYVKAILKVLVPDKLLGQARLRFVSEMLKRMAGFSQQALSEESLKDCIAELLPWPKRTTFFLKMATACGVMAIVCLLVWIFPAIMPVTLIGSGLITQHVVSLGWLSLACCCSVSSIIYCYKALRVVAHHHRDCQEMVRGAKIAGSKRISAYPSKSVTAKDLVAGLERQSVAFRIGTEGQKKAVASAKPQDRTQTDASNACKIDVKPSHGVQFLLEPC